MLPCWPDRDTINDTMPADFREHYPKTTVILDATEVKVNIPSSLLLQSQTYSNYKSTNTFKGLVGISPAGRIIFVSSLYTGSISDTELMERSGFLSLLKSGDEVMADHGFTIHDVLMVREKDGKLHSQLEWPSGVSPDPSFQRKSDLICEITDSLSVCDCNQSESLALLSTVKSLILYI